MGKPVGQPLPQGDPLTVLMLRASGGRLLGMGCGGVAAAAVACRDSGVDRRGFEWSTTREGRLARVHNSLMPKVFLSHSSRDNRQAVALKAWLVSAEPGLDGEIFLDLDRGTGIAAGTRWKEALRQASDRCEAVICLLSEHWDASHECKTEYRTAEDKGKPIFPVRLAPATGGDITGGMAALRAVR